MAKFLIVDDQRNMRTTLAMMLRGAGYEVDEAENGEQGAERGSTGAYDVVLTDLRLGQKDGIDVLRATKEAHPLTEVIMMTAYGTIESAVEAMSLGAFDYIQKPFSEQELLVKVVKALDNRRLAGEVTFLANEFKDRYRFENIIGRSRGLRRSSGASSGSHRPMPSFSSPARAEPARNWWPRPSTRIASGRSARSCRSTAPPSPRHCSRASSSATPRARSPARSAPERGSSRRPMGGPFSSMRSPRLQSHFRRNFSVPSRRTKFVGWARTSRFCVNVRIIAATNQDLLTAVAERRFRQDLYYRLNVARFQLPPLRERREDIPDLIGHFLEKYSKKMGVRPRLHDTAIDALAKYEYPGNIRELEHMIEQAVALVQNGVIMADDSLLPPVSSRAPLSSPPGGGRALADVVDSAERSAIDSALHESGGSRERAAELVAFPPPRCGGR